MCQFVVIGHRDCLLIANRQANFVIDSEIGSRLRAERKKLGLNQSELAAIGAVTLGTQSRYEAGGVPATEYLLRIGEAGADWFWIVTGTERSAHSLNPVAQQMVDAFMALPPALQTALIEHARCLGRTTGQLAAAPTNDRPTLQDRR